MADDVTLILAAIENGDTGAAGRLLPLVYEGLRCSISTPRPSSSRPKIPSRQSS